MYNLSNEDKKWVDGVWDKIDAKIKFRTQQMKTEILMIVPRVNGHMICHGGQTVFGRDICGFYM